MYIQVMTFEQAEKFRWNPFDLTKVTTQFKRTQQTPSLPILHQSEIHAWFSAPFEGARLSKPKPFPFFISLLFA